MPFLPTLPHLSLELWIAAGAVTFLLAILLGSRIGRRRSFVREQKTADLIAYQLGRIADTLQQSALVREAPLMPRPEAFQRNEAPRKSEPAPASETLASPRVSLSMFGR